MRTHATTLTASLLLAGAALGQTSVVVPAANANVEGNALELRPFGTDRARLTQLLASRMVPVPIGRSITEIAYRRDKTAYPTQTLDRSRSTATWYVRLGNLNLAANGGQRYNTSNPTGLYLVPGTGDNNTLRQLFASQPNWPLLPPVTGTTAPFNIVFKLVSPFVYLGPDGLAIDLYCYDTTNPRGYNYVIDAARATVDTGTATRYGGSCPKDANRAYGISSNPGSQDPLQLLLFDGPLTRTAAIGILGFSNQTWGPVNLPLDLSPLGLAGCNLLASIDILLSVPTLSTGAATVSIDVPEAPGLAGAKFWMQWMVIDSRVSQTLPLTFSNGVEFILGKTVGRTGMPASFLYGVNRVQVVRGRYGLVDTGISLVTRITYQ